MNSSDTVQELAKALVAAQAEFKAVGMSGDNKFDKYAYAKLEDYVTAIKPILPTHGLSIITSIDDVIALEDRTTKNGGTEHAARVKITIRLQHVSGEWIETGCWGEGQDRADKAVYKAITGARKYALASALGLATGDDPESDEGAGNSVGNAPPASKQPANRGTPATALPPDAQAFLKDYTDVMVKRGCKVAKAQAVLKQALTKKNISLAATSADDRKKILDNVRAGEWDKYFAPPQQKAA